VVWSQILGLVVDRRSGAFHAILERSAARVVSFLSHFASPGDPLSVRRL